jgi:hypothetical protein
VSGIARREQFFLRQLEYAFAARLYNLVMGHVKNDSCGGGMKEIFVAKHPVDSRRNWTVPWIASVRAARRFAEMHSYTRWYKLHARFARTAFH